MPTYPECQGGEIVQLFDADGCADYVCATPLCEPIDCDQDLFCPYGWALSDDGCELCSCRAQPLRCMDDTGCDQGLSCVFDDLDPEVCCKSGESCDDLYPGCVGQCIYPW